MALVEPKTASPAPVEPTNPAQDTDGDGIPDAILEIPALQAVIAGAPPAVSAPIETFAKRPEDKLFKAGLNLYRSLSGDVGVLFNHFYIAPEDLQAADKAGKLAEIAPDFDSINSQVAKSGQNHPALSAKGPAGGFATPKVQTPPQSTAMPQPSSPAQRRMADQRVENLSPAPLNKQANPGAGKLLNSILKPVV
jgi:hypothetical protein